MRSLFSRSRLACQAVMLGLCVSMWIAGAAVTTKKTADSSCQHQRGELRRVAAGQQVPGIGPATADKILQIRKSYGPLKSVDDLLAIRGIGKKRLDKMEIF